MLKFLLFILLSCTLQFSFASEKVCTNLATKVASFDDNYRPPLEGKVIGNKKLYLYTAPDSQCKMKGIFVIKGDSLTVYNPYKGWLNVLYVAKDGEDYIGWILSKQVKIIGQYGNNP